jgi:hypothetical protein
LGIITKGGGLAINIRGEVLWRRVELKNAQKSLSHLQQITCRGYVNVATLTFVHKTRGQTGG